jgi:predicted acylesterase/phospholipase RssA
MAPDKFYVDLPEPQSFVDGIFKGGGAAGVAYVGSLQALARNGIWFQRVGGTSAGAITAAIIAAGYDANEIDYLAAPFGTRKGPPDNLPSGLEPLDYYSIFIDPPLSPNDLTRETKQDNLVYQAIIGKVIDELIKNVIPLPKIEQYIDQILDEVIKGVPKQAGPYKTKVGPFEAKAGPFKVKVLGRRIGVGPWIIRTPEYNVTVGPFPMNIPALKPAIKRYLVNALTVYPKSLALGQTGLFSTDELRKLFADAAINSVLLVNPWLTVLLNFFAEGGLMRGNVFLREIRKILEAKTRKKPTKFKDLKMDFACVACDITDHKMVVYSTKTTPNMEVAEAVRRSMAIPLFFEPRREGTHEIVDGGTMDNYPLGLFLARDNGFFENSDPDMERVKFGFSPGKLGAGPGASVESYLPSGIPSLPPLSVENRFVTRLFNITATNLTDSPLLKAMLKEYKKSLKNLYEVGIDGNFSTFDFDITKTKYKRMCSKGWKAAIPIIQEGVADGNLSVPTPMVTANPY